MSRESYYLRGSICGTEPRVLITSVLEGRSYWLTVLSDGRGDAAPSLFFTSDGDRATFFSAMTNESSVALSVMHQGVLYYITGDERDPDCEEFQVSLGMLTTKADWLQDISVETNRNNNNCLLTGVTYVLLHMNKKLVFSVEERLPGGGRPSGEGGRGGKEERSSGRGRGKAGRREHISSMRFIPSVYYPLGSCGSPVDQHSELVDNEETWVETDAPVAKAFTTPQECMVGFFYNYCPIGRYCSASCKGNCDFTSECVFDVDQMIFECVEPTVEGPPPPGYFNKIGVWLLIVLLIVLLLILMFSLGVYHYATGRPAYLAVEPGV